MNQLNGYCQIELPDRIGLDALTSTAVNLTDAEAKSIIKALNLDQVKVDPVGYSSVADALLNKPVVISAHVPTESEGRYAKSIFHASIISMLSLADTLEIIFAYEDGENYRLVIITIYADGGEAGEIMSWRITVKAKQITTTNIE